MKLDVIVYQRYLILMFLQQMEVEVLFGEEGLAALEATPMMRSDVEFGTVECVENIPVWVQRTVERYLHFIFLEDGRPFLTNRKMCFKLQM